MGNPNREIIRGILSEYKAKTPTSANLNQEARQFIPGGSTRDVAHFDPYPFYVTHGKGDRIYDVDGNEYIDCLNNMTALLHGHAFPPIVEALQDQANKGTVHAAPMEIQTQLARMITERVKSVEEVRFCNSGTEATLFALRAARVISKRDKIIKFDGSYHGAHDYVEMNVIPDCTSADPPQHNPEVGFPKALEENILITPINDLDKLQAIICNHKNEIAAMIVEPVINIAGMPVTKEYIKTVREITEQNGIFLIFDEVITYRHQVGGFQQILDVKPDFTAFGKIIGGGLPVGAFGARRELMEWFNPNHAGRVGHSGTFSGNAMTMRAGIASLEHYQSKDVEKLNTLGKRLEIGLQKLIEETNFPGHVSRVGSLVYLHLFKGTATNIREYILNLFSTYSNFPYFNIALLNQGIYVYHKSCLEFILSTVMTRKTIDTIIERVAKSMEVVKPLFTNSR